MPVELKIKITKEILEESKNCKAPISFNCPISLAIRDIFPEASTGTENIFLFGKLGKCQFEIPLPAIASNYITDFDFSTVEQRPNLPEIEFTIAIPDEIIETINIESLRPMLTNHQTLELL